MGTAPWKETSVTLTVTIPESLNQQITEKANSLGISLDAAVKVLLQDGIAVQSQREQRIHELAERAASGTEEERNGAAEELGRMIFGK